MERAASAHCAPISSSWAAPRSPGHPECAAGTAHTSGGATIIGSSGHCEYPDQCGCTFDAGAAIDNNLGHSKCTTSGASITSGQGLRCDRRGLGLSGSDTIFSGVRVQLQPDSRTLITAGMLLGHLLSAKIKQDIWDDKFVDMAALLYPDTHTSSYGVQFAGVLASEQGHGEHRFAPRKKKVITINDWVKAFQIYMAVYIQKPGREACAPELLTYMAEIQSIAEDGLDWALYDDQYRRDRASNLSPPPWSAVNQPLHNVIMRKRNSGMPPGQAQQKPSTGNFRNNHNTSSIPVDFCFAYHSRTRRCEKASCPFKHQCFKCNHPRHHPAFTCPVCSAGASGGVNWVCMFGHWGRVQTFDQDVGN